MSQPWYQYPITHGYSTTYQGPGTDTPHAAYDIGTPFHTPLSAILSGTVVKADYTAWGGEIFIKPDNPSYPEYYYYHPDVIQVSVGQHVQAGQIIALSGGENPGYPGALHPALPQWSTGPHTHIGWFTGWQNTPDGVRPNGPDPASLLALAKGGPMPAGSNPISTITSTVGNLLGISGSNGTSPTGVTIGSLPPIGLAPNADVTQALVAIDTVCALVNPFVVQGAQTDTIGALGVGVSFTDPISWVEGFGINLVEDVAALCVRAFFLLIGLVLLFKVVTSFVDVNKLSSEALSTVTKAVSLGA